MRCASILLAALLLPATAVTAGPIGPTTPEVRLALLEAELDRVRDRLEAERAAARLEATRRTLLATLPDAGGRRLTDEDDRVPALAATDGTWSLRVGGRVRVRWLASVLGGPVDGRDRVVRGTELRDARLSFRGHVVDESLTYRVTLRAGRADGELDLSDATIDYAPPGAPGLTLGVGRRRPSVQREERTPAPRLPMIERSAAVVALRDGRSTGLFLELERDDWRLTAHLHDADVDLAVESWLAAARVDARLRGRWRDLRQETGFPGSELAVGAGAGWRWVRDVAAGRPGEPDERTLATADILAVGDGWSALLAGSVEWADEAGAGDRTRWALVARAGVFLDDRHEVSVRAQIGADEDADDDLRVVTLGLTRYVSGHRVKLAADVGYAFDAVGGTWAGSLAGWRADPADRDGQLLGRLQVQLAF